MTLLAAFNVLLYRYSGQKDIVVGTAIAGRSKKETKNLIGFFVNVLALRTKINNIKSFNDLLIKVKATTIRAYSKQDLPFEKIIEHLNIERKQGHDPLIHIAISFGNISEIRNIELDNLKVNFLEIDNKTAKHDLILHLSSLNNEIKAVFQYKTDIFSEETISRLSTSYIDIITQIIEDSSVDIEEVSIISKEEKKKIIYDWNQTQVSYPYKSIHEVFEEQVRRSPDNIAVIYEDKEISYKELNERANQLAHYLLSLGISKEATIAVFMPRRIELFISLLAISKAGGSFLVIDPTLPFDRISYMLQETSVSLVLTVKITKNILPTICSSESYRLVILDENDEIWGGSKKSVGIEVLGNQLAYIVFTSGSTGKPKGVLIEHHSVINFARWKKDFLNIKAGDKIGQLASFNFDGAISETIMALLNVGSLVVIDQQKLTPDEIMEEIRIKGVTLVVMVPSVLRRVSDKTEINKDLRIVSVGEACDKQLAAIWNKKCNFINEYGPAEYTISASGYKYLEQDQEVPIGKPIYNTKIYILDEKLNIVPIGKVGEIYISGAGIARGYINGKGADSFLHNKFWNSSVKFRGKLELEKMSNTLEEFEKKYSKTLKNKTDLLFSEPIIEKDNINNLEGLDNSILNNFNEIKSKIYNNEYYYLTFCRYIQEAKNNSYVSCGINKDILKLLLPHFNFNNVQIIDFGFGNGEIIKELLKLTSNVMGLDLSPYFVQKAKDEGINAKLALIDDQLESFLKLTNLRLNSQDLVISTLVLDRVYDHKKFIENFLGVLKFNSSFVLQTILPIEPLKQFPNIFENMSINEQISLINKLLIESGASEIEIWELPYYVHSKDGFEKFNLWSFVGKKASPEEALYRYMYKTGDYGKYKADGNIICAGRNDGQIKIRGCRVELNEIKQVIHKNDYVQHCEILPVTKDTNEISINAFIELKNKLTVSLIESFENQMVKNWLEVNESIYNSAEESNIYTRGWFNDYSEKEFSKEEIDDWVNASTKKILDLQPSNILEIGCGEGLLLDKIANNSEYYCATDFSQKCIEYLRKRKAKFNNTEFFCIKAHEINEVPNIGFDTIILNSVTQYFPSKKYLCKVLEKSIQLIKDKGVIYIGDIRNYDLIKQFYNSAYLHKIDNNEISDYKSYIDLHMESENELLISPRFFTDLPSKFKFISKVDIQLRRGSFHNEMTKFRYDVILYLNYNTKEINRFDFEHEFNQSFNLEHFINYLKMCSPNKALLKKVLNLRLLDEYIFETHFDRFKLSSDYQRFLREARENLTALDPQLIWQYEKELPYKIFIEFSSDSNFHYDVIFIHNSTSEEIHGINKFREFKNNTSGLNDLTNNPILFTHKNEVINNIKKDIIKFLPNYMVPENIWAFYNLPLNKNSKINIELLKKLNNNKKASAQNKELGLTEKKLVQIFEEVLNIQGISIDDNFFEIGGHSLISTKLLSNVQKQFNVNISLSTFFSNPTVFSLAGIISATQEKLNQDIKITPRARVLLEDYNIN
jgi:amino acid adenylation domain-containing protein